MYANILGNVTKRVASQIFQIKVDIQSIRKIIVRHNLKGVGGQFLFIQFKFETEFKWQFIFEQTYCLPRFHRVSNFPLTFH